MTLTKNGVYQIVELGSKDAMTLQIISINHSIGKYGIVLTDGEKYIQASIGNDIVELFDSNDFKVFTIIKLKKYNDNKFKITKTFFVWKTQI